MSKAMDGFVEGVAFGLWRMHESYVTRDGDWHERLTEEQREVFRSRAKFVLSYANECPPPPARLAQKRPGVTETVLARD